MGSIDAPFNPISLALGAEASFVARTMDSDRKHLISTLRAAAEHPGTALIEIYQNCPIFNDGAFDLIKDSESRQAWIINLEHGAPLRFGTKAVIRNPDGSLTVEQDVTDNDPRIVVHDAHGDDPTYSFALSRLNSRDTRYAPMGVFRDVRRPVYDTLMADQLTAATAGTTIDDAAFDALIRGNDSWTVDF
jgi:2-oxoglutarate ferredoxin oxidoreductase subunit beta